MLDLALAVLLIGLMVWGSYRFWRDWRNWQAQASGK